jgi:hypothetical protein
MSVFGAVKLSVTGAGHPHLVGEGCPPRGVLFELALGALPQISVNYLSVSHDDRQSCSQRRDTMGGF